MKHAIIAIILLLLSGTSEARIMTTDKQEIAVFAGGCFWCMEKPFDHLSGVLSTTSGYTGGPLQNPTYDKISAGGTGHLEALRVVYDPTKVNYQTLLNTFWHNVDPFDIGGQFCDRGSQYRAAIFYQNDAQQRLAELSKQDIAAQLKKDVATEILPAATFYPAEEYHQEYYLKNPVRYGYYRNSCGRDARLKEVWGKPYLEDQSKSP